MGKRCLAPAALVVLALLAGRAAAWNGHGHMVVAKIAYAQLTDGEKVKIAKLLQEHPHYKEYLLKGRPKSVSEAEWAFLQAATWPDWVRGRGLSKKIAAFSKPSWHFVDKPFVSPAERGKFREEDLQPKGETILTALPQKIKEIGGEAPADRALALAWVLHLVGDIHQPLHCTSFYSSTFPKGDRGGNSQLVKAGTRVLPLHTYWDALIGTSKAYRVVEVSATDIARDPRYKREQFKDELARKDIAAWADESFAQARAVAYLDGDLKSQRLPHPRDESGFDVPELPLGYEARARDCAHKRVALAGYRLADQLKAAVK